MTPSEQLDYLRSYAARKPHARLAPAIERLDVMETVDALKRPVVGWRAVACLSAIADALRGAISVGRETR